MRTYKEIAGLNESVKTVSNEQLSEAIDFDAGLKAIESAEKNLKSAGETLGNKKLISDIKNFDISFGKDITALAKGAINLQIKVKTFRSIYASENDLVYN